MQTINLQGKKYAQVKDRIAEAHKTEKNLSIKTSYEIFDKEKKVFILEATVTMEKWQFTGHAIGAQTTKKDFEKLETIAVWRVLALAGFLADGEVASYEEMEDFTSKS